MKSVKKTLEKVTQNTAVALLASIAPTAFAQVPFAAGATTLTADVLALVSPIAGIALIAVGVVAWFGKISWMWFAGLVVGIVLVFGNQQIVSWIRGLFGV